MPPKRKPNTGYTEICILFLLSIPLMGRHAIHWARAIRILSLTQTWRYCLQRRHYSNAWEWSKTSTLDLCIWLNPRKETVLNLRVFSLLPGVQAASSPGLRLERENVVFTRRLGYWRNSLPLRGNATVSYFPKRYWQCFIIIIMDFPWCLTNGWTSYTASIGDRSVQTFPTFKTRQSLRYD